MEVQQVSSVLPYRSLMKVKQVSSANKQYKAASPTMNKMLGDNSIVKERFLQIKQLKQQVSTHQMLNYETTVTITQMKEQRQRELKYKKWESDMKKGRRSFGEVR